MRSIEGDRSKEWIRTVDGIEGARGTLIVKVLEKLD